MKLVRGLEQLPLDVPASAVTIGFFDGVHRGHQVVLRRTVDQAARLGVVPVAVTFDRHPREVFAPGTEPKLLTTLDRKAELIEALGIDTLVVLAFDPDFSTWPPVAFVTRVLAKGLRTKHAVVGSNFTFGHKATGNLATLGDLGAAHGFDVEGVALLKLDGRPVSSSSIREALAGGDLDWPTTALGRRYVVDGTVVAGAGRGESLGFPTANLEMPARMLMPGQGVYAGKAFLNGRGHVAAINIGTNPTFGDEPVHLEAYLLDFDGEVRGRPMSVGFWHRLRDEVRFESADDLARQIKDDVERTRALMPSATERT
jgi:riboflavin kinase/FMN adenylyltransferase